MAAGSHQGLACKTKRGRFMSKCWLAIYTLVIALGLGVPALQADEGHHGNGHHGNKHSQEDREGDREDGDNHHQGRWPIQAFFLA